MPRYRPAHLRILQWMLIVVFAGGAGGCHILAPRGTPPPVLPPKEIEAPRELTKAVLPTYRIEPPDLLQVEVINSSPKPPYRLHSLDMLYIRAINPLPDLPIDGNYIVEPGGTINFGPPYESVNVANLSIDEAKRRIEDHLGNFLLEPETYVSLVSFAGMQQIAGQHLVYPDGTIMLGSYGPVNVVGLTLMEAKQVIEAHLSNFLDEPEVSVDVFALNSKQYYVITQGAGLGDTVTNFPFTGNETVLDAIAQVQGLDSVSSKKIWIARPAPGELGRHQILPVNWNAITQLADPTSNFQIMPGDRVFIAQDKLIALDTMIGKVTSPMERLFGFATLSYRSILSFQQSADQLGGFGGF